MPYKNHEDYLAKYRSKPSKATPRICPVCSTTFYLVKGRTKATSCVACYNKYRTLYSLLSSAKSRAMLKNLEYDLDITWAIAQPDKCPHTGFQLTYTNNGKNYASRKKTTASIDKINPLGGYTKDNCQIVSWWYNCAKQQFTQEDVLTLCQAVVDVYHTNHVQNAETMAET